MVIHILTVAKTLRSASWQDRTICSQQKWQSWWRHQMETFSTLLALCEGNSPVTREFPSQRPVTRSLDVFFHRDLNKRLSKQSRRWWFETLSCSLRRHCNGIITSRFLRVNFHRSLRPCFWRINCHKIIAPKFFAHRLPHVFDLTTITRSLFTGPQYVDCYMVSAFRFVTHRLSQGHCVQVLNTPVVTGSWPIDCHKVIVHRFSTYRLLHGHCVQVRDTSTITSLLHPGSCHTSCQKFLNQQGYCAHVLDISTVTWSLRLGSWRKDYHKAIAFRYLTHWLSQVLEQSTATRSLHPSS